MEAAFGQLAERAKVANPEHARMHLDAIDVELALDDDERLTHAYSEMHSATPSGWPPISRGAEECTARDEMILELSLTSSRGDPTLRAIARSACVSTK